MAHIGKKGVLGTGDDLNLPFLLFCDFFLLFIGSGLNFQDNADKAAYAEQCDKGIRKAVEPGGSGYKPGTIVGQQIGSEKGEDGQGYGYRKGTSLE